MYGIAPVYHACIITASLWEAGLTPMDSPALSPDLNPHENVQDQLITSIEACHPTPYNRVMQKDGLLSIFCSALQKCANMLKKICAEILVNLDKN